MNRPALHTNLLSRFKHMLRPSIADIPLQIAVLAHGVHTKTAVLSASLHQDWNIRFVQSRASAISLLRSASIEILLYDWDLADGDWRELCSACLRCGAAFQLVTSMPTDDLFLAVAGAGGSDVLRKPFTAEQLISSVRFARSLTEAYQRLACLTT